jgi:hypothetical protein
MAKRQKDRQHNGQKKKDKGTTTICKTLHNKTKDRVTQAPLKPGVNSGAPEGKQFLLH